MTPEEANKIIAEFMGYYFIGVEKKRVEDLPCLILTRKTDGERVYKYPYLESLDALVPVWGKLGRVNFFFTWYKDEWEFVLTDVDKLAKTDYEGIRELGALQEAAAIATAKAILELSK